MVDPPLESKLQRNSSVEFRYIRTAGLAGLVCGANIRPNLFEGGGSCLRSRNSNREVWESPYLQVGVDVKLILQTAETGFFDENTPSVARGIR